GGWSLPAGLCTDPDMVRTAYALGVPMGEDLPAAPAAGSAPSFVVSALRDPGTALRPGTQLQRIQIVKGWIDAASQPHEQVFDVAGGPTGASVDEATCTTAGLGADSLCAVWTDPDFH